MDDAWLSTFVPSPSVHDDKPAHRRTTSLLRPVESSRVSDVNSIHTPENEGSAARRIDPPQAELLPRSTSWHHLVRASHNKTSYQLDRRKSSEYLEPHFHGQWAAKELDIIVGDDLLQDNHEDYDLYHEQLQISQDHLDALLESTNLSLDILSSLSNSFRVVEEQTNAFHRQCQDMLAEQRRMTKLADDLKDNLQYYAYLEPITRRLNAPGATNVVTRSEFPEMLANLDSCLDYMQGHSKQREAASYQARYKLLLTRALTLIRVHFTETLRSLAADVSRRIADRQLNDTTQSALLYAKFRVTAPELRDLGIEILKRAVPPANAEAEGEAEYQSLMNELYQSYSATRGRLVFPIVARKMSEISAVDTSVRDLVSFARGAIGFIRGICLDEYDLWCEWFPLDGGVYEFLEGLCEPLFDYVRPRIIHETKLSKLCELCAFLQTSFVEDDEDDDDNNDEPHMNGGRGRRMNFAALVQPALADAQTRLVFLAMSILRDEIEYYKPKAEDLAYPRSARRGSSAGVNGKQPALSGKKTTGKNDTHAPPVKVTTALDDGDQDESHWTGLGKSVEDWYPTLPKAIRLLSRIYRLVNSTVFDDLAHRIVHSTTLSLVSASSQIASKVSPTDANLFLISHLLRLKQQIVAFDIEFVAPEITFDFSSLTNTFYELRDRGGLWNPNTWYKLASGGLLPRVVENMLDAKAELDGRLRVEINNLVNSFASRITAPLTELSEPKKSKDSIDPKRATTAVRGLAEKDVVFLRRKLEEYLDDIRTRETLVAAVKDQVILGYEDWVDLQADGKGTTKIGKLSKKGKGREDEIWSSDVFADWCDATFGTGRAGLGDDESEDGLR
ncbi:Conserved oligomeric Golgi complex subunit 3 isoform A [Sphaceloma murrayae]|uniref:Conserved oligomeric Golgi complex subunit 3 n=1 Tax=Sphaceloma murrayae TaxID=2082308 RepID=A0A2K1R3W5_9PEZI|nr:Conserved oligomeric Golgi complex subunit 3 isoform A [Sphaceloma murrayae]